jgi:hypothetical protein
MVKRETPVVEDGKPSVDVGFWHTGDDGGPKLKKASE